MRFHEFNNIICPPNSLLEEEDLAGEGGKLVKEGRKEGRKEIMTSCLFGHIYINSCLSINQFCLLFSFYSFASVMGVCFG
jgi:hypothetical protein